MRVVPILLASCLFVPAMIAQQLAQAKKPAAPNKNAAKALFAQLSDRFMRESLALVPSNASAAGYHQHPDPLSGKNVELDAVLDDLSPSGYEFQRNFYAAWQTTFHKKTPVAGLGPQEAADWHLLDDQISLQLLEFDKIQNARHNPTVVVEAIGNALFLPLTQEYAAKEVRVGHVMERVEDVPRAISAGNERCPNAGGACHTGLGVLSRRGLRVTSLRAAAAPARRTRRC